MKHNHKKSSGNLVELVVEQIEKHPHREALRIPVAWSNDAVTRYETATFGEMGRKIASYQRGFRKAGYRPRDRVIIMIPPSVDLYCIIAAMLASGMIPVLVDISMGFRKMLTAFDDSMAGAIITKQKFCRIRYFIPRLWKYRCYSVDGDGIGIRPISHLQEAGSHRIDIVPCDRETTGIISFTSGSTGRPKGADRKHWGLKQQHLANRAILPDRPGDIDMTAFPVYVLHNLACGMPTLIAAVDFAAVKRVNPSLILQQIREFKPTRLSAAPVFMKRVAEHIIHNKMRLPSMRLIVTGGAPVPRKLCAILRQAFPGAEIRVVYGSTEAEPISSISIDDILESVGEGFLVGKPYGFVRVKIVNLPPDHDSISDHTLERYTLQIGEIGEIVVAGDHVSRGYVANPGPIGEYKIPCPDGSVWHRTGDTGYLDRKGRIWLTGRARDVVQHGGRLIHPYLLEKKIDEVPGVVRSAVVASGTADRPILAVVLDRTAKREASLKAIRELMRGSDCDDISIREMNRIPLDKRHNSKIDRPALIKMLD
ncbi:MAG: hypothetical protein A2176_05380 [Spirochaetes bacterium RBG_13_51_14]|nr:MAG: hypothetical protein A2176_05380 [Spirochaetes bacterium RBG_13_51_14]